MGLIDRRDPAVLDASVAVRWLTPEVGSSEALVIYERYAWFAPRLLLTEVASALRRKVVVGDFRTEQALEAFTILLDMIERDVIRLHMDETVVGSALMAALQSGHKLPDCVYLALAEREGARLVTADMRLARLAEARNIAVELVPSA